jgi:hypothetical protein
MVKERKGGERKIYGKTRDHTRTLQVKLTCDFPKVFGDEALALTELCVEIKKGKEGQRAVSFVLVTLKSPQRNANVPVLASLLSF